MVLLVHSEINFCSGFTPRDSSEAEKKHHNRGTGSLTWAVFTPRINMHAE